MTGTPTKQVHVFPAQSEFVLCDAANVAAVTGIGGGKSEGGAIKLLTYLDENPGALTMVTAPTYPMLRDATLRSIFRVFPMDWYEFRKQEMRLIYRNGAEVLLRTTDNPEHLRGPNLALVWMDEAAVGTISDPDAQLKAFEVLQGRLRQPGYPTRFWVTTTPKGFNWVYRVFVRDHPNNPNYRLFSWPSYKNPHLPEERVAALLDLYSGAFAAQEIEGRFVVTDEGMYFDREAVEALAEDVAEPKGTARGGLVRVWRPPVVGGKYVAGGDLAWGERGAYSCMVIADFQTGEQVAELHGRPKLDEVAYEMVSLCRKYNDAYALIERNGEGAYVVERMVELGYGERLYARSLGSRGQRSEPGWLTDATTRPVMLSALDEAVRARAIVPRCEGAITELRQFVRNDRGRPGPVQGAYADHVMAWAMAVQARQQATFGSSGKPVFTGAEW